MPVGRRLAAINEAAVAFGAGAVRIGNVREFFGDRAVEKNLIEMKYELTVVRVARGGGEKQRAWFLLRLPYSPRSVVAHSRVLLGSWTHDTRAHISVKQKKKKCDIACNA